MKPRVVYQTHGLRYTREYRVWVGMRDRCYNPNAKSFVNYGGRGITVCDRWNVSFLNFFEDMGYRPGDGFDLARINPNGNYEPGNVMWQTHALNMKNLRRRSAY